MSPLPKRHRSCSPQKAKVSLLAFAVGRLGLVSSLGHGFAVFSLVGLSPSHRVNLVKPLRGGQEAKKPCTRRTLRTSSPSPQNLEYLFCRALAVDATNFSCSSCLIPFSASTSPRFPPLFSTPDSLFLSYPRANRRAGTRVYLELVYPR